MRQLRTGESWKSTNMERERKEENQLRHEKTVGELHFRKEFAG